MALKSVMLSSSESAKLERRLLEALENRRAVKARELVLREGANPSAIGRDGYTALMRAATIKDVELTRVLLEGGADAHARGPEGTALDIARRNFNRDVADVLKTHIKRQELIQDIE